MQVDGEAFMRLTQPELGAAPFSFESRLITKIFSALDMNVKGPDGNDKAPSSDEHNCPRVQKLIGVIKDFIGR